MYSGFKKGDSVYLVRKEVCKEQFEVVPAEVFVKGRAYLDIKYNALSVRFKDNELTTSDLFGRIYYLFHTEQEAYAYIKERENSNIMKQKIQRLIQSKCTFKELEDIYLYLEERYPKEMRC